MGMTPAYEKVTQNVHDGAIMFSSRGGKGQIANSWPVIDYIRARALRFPYDLATDAFNPQRGNGPVVGSFCISCCGHKKDEGFLYMVARNWYNQ
jgi:hypothetical protein